MCCATYTINLVRKENNDERIKHYDEINSNQLFEPFSPELLVLQYQQLFKKYGTNEIDYSLERLEKAPIEEVVVTNSELKPDLDKIKQVDIAPKIVGTMLDISG